MLKNLPECFTRARMLHILRREGSHTYLAGWESFLGRCWGEQEEIDSGLVGLVTCDSVDTPALFLQDLIASSTSSMCPYAFKRSAPFATHL